MSIGRIARRKALAVGQAFLACALLNAFGPAWADANKPVIALLPGVVDPFYFTMYHGAQQAAKEVGAELLFQIPKAWNTADQVPILKAMIAKRPDVLVIAPVDKQQLIQPLKEASEAGIKVITVDTFIGNGQYRTGAGNADFPYSYVASDNVEGGRIAAHALAKAIGGSGAVYIENNKPGISSTDQRMEGFIEVMKGFPQIKLLETQYNEDDANRAAAHVAAVLARTPDLAGIFAANTFSGKGAAEGVKNAGKKGKVKVVTYDAVPGIDKDLKSGLIDIAIAQKPAEMGYVGVKYAADLVRGKTIPVLFGTGFVVMDKDNVDDPEVRKFIYSN